MKNCFGRYSLTVCVFGILLASAVPILASKLGIFSAHQDIGSPKKKGKIKYESKRDTYLITGGGANIWGKSDSFHFVYEQVTGDVTLTTNIAWVGQRTEAHRKAGIMIRQSLTPDSPYVDVMLHGDGMTSLQYRESVGDVTKETRSEVKQPSIIRLQRKGDEFSIAAGEDLDNLKPTGPVTLKLPPAVYVGFAVCAHNADLSETALFKSPKILTPAANASLRLPVITTF